MSTNRTIVSRIRSTHRLLSADTSINDRTILAEVKGIAKTLIKRYTDRRKLWESPTIFTLIPCLEMQPISLAECCDYSGEMTISRSKKKLPKILDGNQGLMIQGVYSPNGMTKLRAGSPERFSNYLKLGLKPVYIFYWIQNGYLYVTDEFVKLVKISAFFEEDVPDDIMYPECECTTIPPSPCRNPLDEEFKCPGSLEEEAIRLTSASLLQTYFRIPQDHTSDNKDDQVNKK